VLKALEEARKDKRIGNSLSAYVHLHATPEEAQFLAGFDRLDQLFIVSGVEVHGGATQFSVRVEAAPGEKCERCWVVTPQVGTHVHHPTLCTRCAHVVELELV
jgi:isoleucyl-tRNA synthetase